MLPRSSDSQLFAGLSDIHPGASVDARKSHPREAGFVAAIDGHPPQGKLFRAEAAIFWISMAALALATIYFGIRCLEFLQQ